MISGLLSRWGVDPGQFRALLRISLLMEWRQQKTAGSSKKSMPLIVRGLLFYLIMGFSLAFSLVSRVNPAMYTFLCYSYFMMMTGFAVIVECSQVLLNPDDMDILGHRPVSSRTIFLARFIHLLIFILIFSVILCVGPALISLFLKAPGFYTLMFTLAALLSVVFAAALMMLIYTFLLRLMRFKRLKPVIFVLQFVMTLALIFMYQLIARSGWEAAAATFRLSESWLKYTPPGWFTAVAGAALDPAAGGSLIIAAAGIIGSVIFFRSGFKQLSLSYLNDLSKSAMHDPDMPVRRISETAGRTRWRVFGLRDPESRAGFFLALNLLRRDRTVQMGVLPILAIPLMIVIWGVVDGDIVDPFHHVLQLSNLNSQQMLPFFIMFFIYMTVKGSVYSRDWEARWIFQSAPLRHPSRLVFGAQAGLLSGIGIPFLILLFVLLTTQFFWLHVLQVLIYLTFFGMVFLGFLNLQSKELPFTRKRERGERISGFSFFLLLIPFQTAALFLHRLAYRSQGNWWMVMAGMAALIVVLTFWGGKKTVKAIQ